MSGLGRLLTGRETEGGRVGGGERGGREEDVRGKGKGRDTGKREWMCECVNVLV